MKIWSLGLLLALTACSQTGKTVNSGSKNRIRVFYNNDNIAYLEPCGCRISPIGGMDRRWNAMKGYPDESRVFVDAGNALFKSTKATEYLAPQWYEQATGVIEAYNLLGADAATVGSTEFALGVKKFQELAKAAHYPYVSANIYWKGTNKRFLAPSVMIKRYGKKIGIFGVFHPSLPLPDELEARDPVAAAKEAVKNLRDDGADLVIALSHQGYDNDVEFVKKVPGIDLVVGAVSQSLLQKPVTEGDTLLVQLSNEGQMLGMVEYDAAHLPKRTDFLVAELNAEYNNPPHGMANPMKSLVAVTNLKMGEANRRLDERIWNAHQGKVQGYQSFLSCRDCHSKQAEFQEGKLHSAAFLTLLAKKKEMNLDCVKCHSVGMGQEGGFHTLKDAFRDEAGNPVPLSKIRALAGKDFPKAEEGYREKPGAIRPDVARWIAAMKKAEVQKAFVGVQCENCHGPRPDHPFGDDQPAGAVLAKTCLQCHTPAQMPSWYDGAGKVKMNTVKAAMKTMACPR